MHLRSFATVLTVATALVALAQKPVYWLGTKEGGKLVFQTRVPDDAAKVVTHRAAAPGRDASTKPHYKRAYVTIDGRKVTVHRTELGWETKGLRDGSLTWLSDAGLGAEWVQVNAQSSAFSPFADALEALSTEYNPGWRMAKVVVVEGGETAPTFQLNFDGTYGQASPAAGAQQVLDELTSHADLNDDEVGKVRNAFLALANDARQNPQYRRQNNCTKVLDLPKGLKPLVLDDALTSAAQDQADYCARTKQVTHSQSDPAKANVGLRVQAAGAEGSAVYEAAGGGALGDYPKAWMTSNTHYRPWWNLDNQVVTKVGFGVRKGSDGTWYIVAVLM